MKTIKTAFACMFTVLFVYTGQAQSEESTFIKGKEVFLRKDMNVKLKSFSAKNIDSKRQLTWVISHVKSNGTYIIYRSVDKENYEIIGIEQSIAISHQKDIEYSFIDNSPINSSVAYYKIYFLGVNNYYYASPVISIDLSNIHYQVILSNKNGNENQR